MSIAVEIRGPRATLIDDAALFAQCSDFDALNEAWQKVYDNRGASGGDRITVHAFRQNSAGALARLSDALSDGSYHPGPVRGVDIPKPNGGMRHLSIPCVIDRIAQTSVATALTPHLEDEFEDASFGYRRGRSVQQAVTRLQLLHAQGFDHVVDADIHGYFDAIPHDGLLARLRETLSHGPLTQLIGLWLADAAPMGRGIAQGSPLSPLLANLYLDRIDEAFNSGGARIIRFADDFVILTKDAKSADGALNRAEQMLAAQGLLLNRDKTRVTDFKRGFRFLGHMFIRSMAMKVSPDTADARDVDALLADIARDDERAAAKAGAPESDATQEAKGYSPGLRTLYVTQKGRRLTIRNQAFSVEELIERTPVDGEEAEAEWSELIAIPHQRIDRIDLGNAVTISPLALDHAVATATPIAFVDGHGATRATLGPVLSQRAGRHLAQAATALDPDRRLALAKILVEGRLRNQRNLLRKLLRDREPHPGLATKAIAVLTDYIGHGGDGRVASAKSVNIAMGFEGAGTAAYWPAISALCAEGFSFPVRERRPNPDRANIVLNVFAWLLHRDISAAILKVALHPGFGVLHGISDQHDACVYDLMEEFRSHFVEGLLVYATQRRFIRLDHFQPVGAGWRLAGDGMQSLIRAYENRANGLSRISRKVSFKRLMVEQAQALAQHHEGRADYKPFESPF